MVELAAQAIDALGGAASIAGTEQHHKDGPDDGDPGQQLQGEGPEQSQQERHQRVPFSRSCQRA